MDFLELLDRLLLERCKKYISYDGTRIVFKLGFEIHGVGPQLELDLGTEVLRKAGRVATIMDNYQLDMCRAARPLASTDPMRRTLLRRKADGISWITAIELAMVAGEPEDVRHLVRQVSRRLADSDLSEDTTDSDDAGAAPSPPPQRPVGPPSGAEASAIDGTVAAKGESGSADRQSETTQVDIGPGSSIFVLVGASADEIRRVVDRVALAQRKAEPSR